MHWKGQEIPGNMSGKGRMVSPIMLRTLETDLVGHPWVTSPRSLYRHPLHQLPDLKKMGASLKVHQISRTSLKATPLLARLTRMCVKFSPELTGFPFRISLKFRHIFIFISPWASTGSGSYCLRFQFPYSFLHTILIPVRLEQGLNALKRICKAPRRVRSFKKLE